MLIKRNHRAQRQDSQGMKQSGIEGVCFAKVQNNHSEGYDGSKCTQRMETPL